MNRLRLLSLAAGGVGIAVALALLLVPRQAPPGSVVLFVASAGGDALAPVRVQIGDRSLSAGGAAPGAPAYRQAGELVLAPGSYPVRVTGVAQHPALAVLPGQVSPLLLGVRDGRVVSGGIYAGAQDVSLGLQELSGRLAPLPPFSLVDQDGRAIDRSALLGRDTVIAAFHTTCRETCPLYTGLLFQLQKVAPEVRLLEVTTDPATDTPAALAAYRGGIGAGWTFATGQVDDVSSFWAPLGVSVATGDSHTSALVLVDRYGFIRAAFSGTPDVGGTLPVPLLRQLDDPGRTLLNGHGEGWGAPEVVDRLRTLAASGPGSLSEPAPAFSLPALDGSRLSLEQLRGQPVVLNFWWSGCPPCRQEMPLLQGYADAHPNARLVLVDPVDGVDGARAFVASLHVRAPVLLDDGGRIAAAYGVAAYPTSVFVRTDGTVASRYPGALTADLLGAHMANLGGG